MQIFFISRSSLNPPYISTCFSSFTVFLSASPSFSSIVYFASVLCPPNISIDSTSSWSPPESIFSRLRHPILFQLALLLFSPIQPYQLWPATLFWRILYFILPFQLPRVSICFSEYIPNSVFSAVLLVVLEHPSIFLVAVICTVSGCFTNFAFPSHTSPAYANFGTITFIRMHF